MKFMAGSGRFWPTWLHLQDSYYLEMFKIFSPRVLRRLRAKCLWCDEHEEVQAYRLLAALAVIEEGHRCQHWAFKAGYVILELLSILQLLFYNLSAMVITNRHSLCTSCTITKSITSAAWICCTTFFSLCVYYLLTLVGGFDRTQQSLICSYDIR